MHPVFQVGHIPSPGQECFHAIIRASFGTTAIMENDFVVLLENEFGIDAGLTLAGFVKSLRTETLLMLGVETIGMM